MENVWIEQNLKGNAQKSETEHRKNDSHEKTEIYGNLKDVTTSFSHAKIYKA